VPPNATLSFPRTRESSQRWIEVHPLGIIRLDQLQFPFPPPFLQRLLPSDGLVDLVEGFVVDQPMDVVLRREALDRTFPVLVYAFDQV